MNKINWVVRFQNPVFVAQLIMSIIIPMVGYAGIQLSDITSFGILIHLLVSSLQNPYVIGLIIFSVYNAIIDPTTKGHKDSTEILNKL